MSAKIYDIIDTENGVKFHVNRMEDNLLIDDINVKPGIKTVKFDFMLLPRLILLPVKLSSALLKA